MIATIEIVNCNSTVEVTTSPVLVNVEIQTVGARGPQGETGPKGDTVYVGNIDGGSPSSTYSLTQIIDGGTP